MFNKKFLKKKIKGQTMIELVVAISIILVGVVSTLVLTTTTIRGGKASKMQVIAANLAREGIEVARMQRDNNWLRIESNDLAPSEWDSGLKGASNDYTAIAEFDPSAFPHWSLNYSSGAADLDACISGSQQCQLHFNSATGIYNHDGSADPMPYYRLIQTNEICVDGSGAEYIRTSGSTCDSGDEKVGIQVLSQVRWQEKDNWRDLEFEDHLYNWK